MTVGPSSVGYRLTSEALCFGGQQCTTTDVAIAAGVAPRTICTTEDALASLQPAMVYATMREIRRKVEAVIDSMKVSVWCSLCFHSNTHTSRLHSAVFFFSTSTFSNFLHLYSNFPASVFPCSMYFQFQCFIQMMMIAV